MDRFAALLESCLPVWTVHGWKANGWLCFCVTRRESQDGIMMLVLCSRSMGGYSSKCTYFFLNSDFWCYFSYVLISPKNLFQNCSIKCNFGHTFIFLFKDDWILSSGSFTYEYNIRPCSLTRCSAACPRLLPCSLPASVTHRAHSHQPTPASGTIFFGITGDQRKEERRMGVWITYLCQKKNGM